MAKPKAKRKDKQRNGDSVIKAKNSKVQKKKQQKPHGNGKPGRVKSRLLAEAATTSKVVKQNGTRLAKPGAFVLAPPESPKPPSTHSDSNSEDDEYIDRFFGDVDFDGSEAMSESSAESEPSEEDSDESGSAEEEDESDDDVDSGEYEEEGDNSVNGSHLLTIIEGNENDSEDKEGSESDLSDSDDELDFSPSEVVWDPGMMMDHDDDDSYEFNYDDGEEVSIGSYSESQTSSSESDPDEFVEGNCRFVDVDESKIHFPNQGSAIVEIENESDSCPELVPIPDSFKNVPSKPVAKQPREVQKRVHEPKETLSNQIPAEPADLDYYLSQDFSLVLLHLKEPLFFHGMLSIKVIAGSVELLHHTSTSDVSSEITAMATVDDYPVRICPSAHSGNTISRCLGDPTLKRFHYRHLMQIKQTYATGHSILLLKAIDQTHITFVQEHMSKRLLPDDFRKGAESILKCKFYRSHPKQFSPIVNLAEKNPCSRFPRIVTVGGKNTGKSTFNKCLVNSLLSEGNEQVLYVDLDIGQPELGVPQTISAHLLDSPIIGKGFLKCHATQPYYSLVYGQLNVALDPIRYANCVKALFHRLNRESDLTPIPWVVNTMGYVQGIGLDLMHFILTELKPTRVLQFRHLQHHLENFHVRLDAAFLRKHESTLLHTWNIELDFEWQSANGFAGNRAEDLRQLKGSEARQMNILSHLGLALNKDFATALNEVEPICAPLDKLRIVHVGENRGAGGRLLDAINGNLVYLCWNEPEDTEAARLQCHGVGLVRAVDEHINKIYLVTGMDRKNLRNVNCLALTSIPLPIPVLLSQSTTTKGSATVPYICQTGTQSVLFRNVIDRPFRTEAASKR